MIAVAMHDRRIVVSVDGCRVALARRLLTGAWCCRWDAAIDLPDYMARDERQAVRWSAMVAVVLSIAPDDEERPTVGPGLN